jgi:hypothetical protein
LIFYAPEAFDLERAFEETTSVSGQVEKFEFAFSVTMREQDPSRSGGCSPFVLDSIEPVPSGQ